MIEKQNPTFQVSIEAPSDSAETQESQALVLDEGVVSGNRVWQGRLWRPAYALQGQAGWSRHLN